MHRLLLHNHTIRETTEHLLTPGQVGLLNGWGVFSTLRVIDGVMFAFDRHWRRMERDARLLRVPFPADPDWLAERLYRLIDANGAEQATLRVAIVRNKGGMFEGPNIEADFDLIAFTKDLKDWGRSARLELAPKSRHADTVFAGTKMLSWCFNLIQLEQAQERGFDEIVMLNERGEVSECTSANLFAVFGDRVVTPPLDSGCLPGVTRAILLEEIRRPGLMMAEERLTLEQFLAADEIFMTSSTRDLLPVTEVRGEDASGQRVQGNWKADGAVTRSLAEAFRQNMARYAVRHRRNVVA